MAVVTIPTTVTNDTPTQEVIAICRTSTASGTLVARLADGRIQALNNNYTTLSEESLIGATPFGITMAAGTDGQPVPVAVEGAIIRSVGTFDAGAAYFPHTLLNFGKLTKDFADINLANTFASLAGVAIDDDTLRLIFSSPVVTTP